MDSDETKDYLSQFEKGKVTRGEAELKTAIGHETMNRPDEIEKAKKLIKKIIYITLATSNKKHVPWNTPLFCAYDDDYTFYWLSARHCVHSFNIAENENVALVIYDSTVPEGEGFGVYIEAKAIVVDDPVEIKRALKLLQERGGKPMPSVEEASGSALRNVYKAVPTTIWVNDIKEKKDAKLKSVRLEIKLR